MDDDRMDLDAPEDGRLCRKKKGRGDRRKKTATADAAPGGRKSHANESMKPRQSIPRPKRPLPAVTVEIHSPWLFPELEQLKLQGPSSGSIAADFECQAQSPEHAPGRGGEGSCDRISPHDVLVDVQPECPRSRDPPDWIRLSAHLGIAENGGDGHEHAHVRKISPGACEPAFCSLSAPPSVTQLVHARHPDRPPFAGPPDEGRGPMEDADQWHETGEAEVSAPPQSPEDAGDNAALSREGAQNDDSTAFTQARIHPAALSSKQSRYLSADPFFPSSRTSSFSPRDADAERERIAAERAAAKAAYKASLMHLSGGSIDDETSSSPKSNHEQLIVEEAIISPASLQHIVISKLAEERPTVLDSGIHEQSDASKATCPAVCARQVSPAAQACNTSKNVQDEDALAHDTSLQTQARPRLRLGAAAPLQQQPDAAQSNGASGAQEAQLAHTHNAKVLADPARQAAEPTSHAEATRARDVRDAREHEGERVLREALEDTKQQLESCEKQLWQVTKQLKEQQQAAQSLRVQVEMAQQAQHRPLLHLKRHAGVQTESPAAVTKEAGADGYGHAQSASHPWLAASDDDDRVTSRVRASALSQHRYNLPQRKTAFDPPRMCSAPALHAMPLSLPSPHQQASVADNTAVSPRTIVTPQPPCMPAASDQRVTLDGGVIDGGIRDGGPKQLLAQGADCVIIGERAVASRIVRSGSTLLAAQHQNGGRPASSLTSISADSQPQLDIFDDISANTSRACTPVTVSQGKKSSVESKPTQTSSRDSSMFAEMGSEDVLTCVKVFEEDAYAMQPSPAPPASAALVYVDSIARGQTATKRAEISNSMSLLQSQPLMPHRASSPTRAAALSPHSDSTQRGCRSTPSKTRHALIVRPSTCASPARPMRPPGSASPVPQAGHSGHELHVPSDVVFALQQHDLKDGKPLAHGSGQDTGPALDDLLHEFEDGALSMFASVLDLTFSGVSPKIPRRSRPSRSPDRWVYADGADTDAREVTSENEASENWLPRRQRSVQTVFSAST